MTKKVISQHKNTGTHTHRHTLTHAHTHTHTQTLEEHASVVNFEHISHFNLLLLLLNSIKQIPVDPGKLFSDNIFSLTN